MRYKPKVNCMQASNRQLRYRLGIAYRLSPGARPPTTLAGPPRRAVTSDVVTLIIIQLNSFKDCSFM